jgi:SAM-dependent methyltransferase
MVDPGVLEFVRAELPDGARVLEIGAGDGALAGALRAGGRDVVAIDPEPGGPDVEPSALADLDAPDGAFGAAVAIVSLHHVEPLRPSLARLARLVAPGGALVVDEIDVAALDERAAAWWLARGGDAHTAPAEHGPHLHGDRGPAAVVAAMRGHIHALAELRRALAEWFELGPVVRGPYLHRWHLPPGHLDAEQAAIAADAIPAVGARFTGVRRATGPSGARPS